MFINGGGDRCVARKLEIVELGLGRALGGVYRKPGGTYAALAFVELPMSVLRLLALRAAEALSVSEISDSLLEEAMEEVSEPAILDRC